MSPGPRSKSRARRLRVLITAGPTREHLDPVRYLSNESSGRMGFALAERAARRGHRVTLIAGPVALETPAGVRRLDVLDARELLRVVRREFARADALYMAAAVCDWRPARRLAGKWRAKDSGAERTRVELVKNPDVLASVAAARAASDPRLVVGFALETGAGVRRARRKLAAKGADWIVLNDASALDASEVSVTILGKDGSLVKLARRPKGAVAEVLLDLLERVPGQ